MKVFAYDTGSILIIIQADSLYQAWSTLVDDGYNLRIEDITELTFRANGIAVNKFCSYWEEV